MSGAAFESGLRISDLGSERVKKYYKRYCAITPRMFMSCG